MICFFGNCLLSLGSRGSCPCMLCSKMWAGTPLSEDCISPAADVILPFLFSFFFETVFLCGIGCPATLLTRLALSSDALASASGVLGLKESATTARPFVLFF